MRLGSGSARSGAIQRQRQQGRQQSNWPATSASRSRSRSRTSRAGSRRRRRHVRTLESSAALRSKWHRMLLNPSQVAAPAAATAATSATSATSAAAATQHAMLFNQRPAGGSPGVHSLSPPCEESSNEHEHDMSEDPVLSWLQRRPQPPMHCNSVIIAVQEGQYSSAAAPACRGQWKGLKRPAGELDEDDNDDQDDDDDWFLDVDTMATHAHPETVFARVA